MISTETYDKLQEYKEIGLSILKSSEKLNLSYKTAYTWWNKSDEEFTSFQKQHEFILDNYRQYLIEQIRICPQINNSRNNIPSKDNDGCPAYTPRVTTDIIRFVGDNNLLNYESKNYHQFPKYWVMSDKKLI